MRLRPQKPILCGSRKYPYPHHGGNWKFRGGGGGSEAQEIPEGRGVQGLQIRQNCSDDSTEVMEGVTLTPEIFGNKQGAA